VAELVIRLRRDPQTGKQDIVITLHSDEDALPHEHEEQHRAIVEKIIGKIGPDKAGKVIVEREPGKEPTSPIGETTPEKRQAEHAWACVDRGP